MDNMLSRPVAAAQSETEVPGRESGNLEADAMAMATAMKAVTMKVISISEADASDEQPRCSSPNSPAMKQQRQRQRA